MEHMTEIFYCKTSECDTNTSITSILVHASARPFDLSFVACARIHFGIPSMVLRVVSSYPVLPIVLPVISVVSIKFHQITSVGKLNLSIDAAVCLIAELN